MDDQVRRDWEAMLQAWEKIENELLASLENVREKKNVVREILEPGSWEAHIVDKS